MGIVSTIKDRLQDNAAQRKDLRSYGSGLSRSQEIHLEYLRLEAQTFQDMLSEIQNKRWYIFSNKKFLLTLSIFAMSMYVMGIFYMFEGIDLSKVEQWQFAMAALPFWLILMIIPMVLITIFTTWKTRS